MLSEGHGTGGSWVCPGPLWDTRPCLAGPCYNFTWEISAGTVQCVRSDGLVVTGKKLLKEYLIFPVKMDFLDVQLPKLLKNLFLNITKKLVISNFQKGYFL